MQIFREGFAGDRFGTSVALDGNVLAVGASHDDDEVADGGAVYVYERFEGEWVLSETLRPLAPQAGALFGADIALEGVTLAVGSAFWDLDAGAGTDDGRAWIFRGDDGWNLDYTIDGGEPGDGMGSDVDVSGDVVVAGARQVDGEGSGYVAVARDVFGDWVAEALIFAPDEGTDLFGDAVAVDGTRLVVGAPDHDVEGTSTGAAFVYDYDGEDWSGPEELTATDGALDDDFGIDVAVDGDLIVVGARQRDTGGLADAGAAYPFARVSGAWTPLGALEAPDAGLEDLFGSALHVQGAAVLVGAWGRRQHRRRRRRRRLRVLRGGARHAHADVRRGADERRPGHGQQRRHRSRHRRQHRTRRRRARRRVVGCRGHPAHEHRREPAGRHGARRLAGGRHDAR